MRAQKLQFINANHQLAKSKERNTEIEAENERLKQWQSSAGQISQQLHQFLASTVNSSVLSTNQESQPAVTGKAILPNLPLETLVDGQPTYTAVSDHSPNSTEDSEQNKDNEQTNDQMTFSDDDDSNSKLSKRINDVTQDITLNEPISESHSRKRKYIKTVDVNSDTGETVDGQTSLVPSEYLDFQFICYCGSVYLSNFIFTE